MPAAQDPLHRPPLASRRHIVPASLPRNRYTAVRLRTHGRFDTNPLLFLITAFLPFDLGNCFPQHGYNERRDACLGSGEDQYRYHHPYTILDGRAKKIQRSYRRLYVSHPKI